MSVRMRGNMKALLSLGGASSQLGRTTGASNVDVNEMLIERMSCLHLNSNNVSVNLFNIKLYVRYDFEGKDEIECKILPINRMVPFSVDRSIVLRTVIT